MDHSLAGEWVHQKIDAAAQSELLPVEAARAQPNDESLGVVCEPGTVVAASAARVRRAVGLDATRAMLDQARASSRTKSRQCRMATGRCLPAAIR